VPGTQATVDLLRAVPLFADLSKSELRLVATITKPLDFAPGAPVVSAPAGSS